MSHGEGADYVHAADNICDDPDTNPLSRLRRLCRALPQTTERLSHGEPTWFVGDKRVFVMYANRHHDDRIACWLAAPPLLQSALIAARPDEFFRPPYVGHRGWLGVWLDVSVDWDEVADLVTEAYRMTAPKRALLEMESQLTGGVE